MLTNRKGSEVDANNLDLLLGELGNNLYILLGAFYFVLSSAIWYHRQLISSVN